MAGQLPGDAGQALARAAREAFTNGMQAAAIAGVILLLGAAALATATLRKVPVRDDRGGTGSGGPRAGDGLTPTRRAADARAPTRRAGRTTPARPASARVRRPSPLGVRARQGRRGVAARIRPRGRATEPGPREAGAGELSVERARMGVVAQTFGTPFIGRGDELARLTGVLERARDGDPRAVLVAGDAGVGKTRTLTEAAAHAAAAGMTVLTGHCVDLGDVGLPYLPFTEILGALAADDRFAPALAAHPAVHRLTGGGSAAGTAPDPGSRLQLFEGIALLLADLSDVTPLLLILEDLHWADQSSRDLLRFLLSRGVLQRPAPGGPARRLAVFASYRADDLHRRHPLRPLLAELIRLPAVDRLELRPMADADVARLVRALRTGPVSDTTVRRIVDRAEGNAFYAEELLAALPGDDGPGSPAMPSGLADVLLIRIEQLSETAQQVLRTAAVAGRRVEHDLLRDAVQLPQDELESALREAVGHQLLLPGGDATYSFRHALTREAVYADLLPGERVRLHGLFAKLLAGKARSAKNAAERAHHSRESHDLADALTASLEAADHAQGVGAPAEELRHLETALELWPAVDAAARPEGGTVALTLRASAAAARAGESHRAVHLTRDALARAGSDATPNSPPGCGTPSRAI